MEAPVPDLRQTLRGFAVAEDRLQDRVAARRLETRACGVVRDASRAALSKFLHDQAGGDGASKCHKFIDISGKARFVRFKDSISQKAITSEMVVIAVRNEAAMASDPANDPKAAVTEEPAGGEGSPHDAKDNGIAGFAARVAARVDKMRTTTRQNVVADPSAARGSVVRPLLDKSPLRHAHALVGALADARAAQQQCKKDTASMVTERERHVGSVQKFLQERPADERSTRLTVMPPTADQTPAVSSTVDNSSGEKDDIGVTAADQKRAASSAVGEGSGEDADVCAAAADADKVVPDDCTAASGKGCAAKFPGDEQEGMDEGHGQGNVTADDTSASARHFFLRLRKSVRRKAFKTEDVCTHVSASVSAVLATRGICLTDLLGDTVALDDIVARITFAFGHARSAGEVSSDVVVLNRAPAKRARGGGGNERNTGSKGEDDDDTENCSEDEPAAKRFCSGEESETTDA